MGGADEEWVKAAMTDDTMVVELLVRLHASEPSPPPALEWPVRQRRSRPAATRKPAQSQRASPSTPLWWTGGGTSLSGGSGGAGGGGSEESSRPHTLKLSTDARSKLNGDSGKAISKRSRKKKTLTELKDEENSLLKERRNLKRDIAALCVNLEKQIAKNENLKRIKIELQPLLDRETASSTKEPVSDNQLHPAGPAITPPLISDKAAALHSNDCPTSPIKDATTTHAFMLPDLNMPFEDACPDIVCSVS
ncbi:hypothetical protein SASPL_125989 [Salvia splendens]|uniref:BZIP domain-containing protein n=1 Tax=Salvia splendens TaxID=180675 RepID=A0A8X8XL04_SALSN|nr:uncharacterized protein LOC121747831 [Salvia splendens]KAG6413281.1 hypothetical protein SASPL_125989 [Salvia splendens]